MALTPNEIKFLTILNETRLSDGKMSGWYFEQIKGLFEFSNKELNDAVKKLVKMDLLTEIDAGGNEHVYFHTKRVIKEDLDKDLIKIRH